MQDRAAWRLERRRASRMLVAARELGHASARHTFFGLLLVTFLIGRVMPIDPVLAVVGDRAPAGRLRAGRASSSASTSRSGSSSAIYLGKVARAAISARSVLTAQPGARRHPPRLSRDARARHARHADRRRCSACRWACSPPSHQGRWPDQVVRVVGLFGYSMPVFWLGLMGLLLFYAKLGWVGGPGPLGVAYRGHRRRRSPA